MYSDKKNVLELVALLKAHGITNIVLSPGSRNSPLIHSFATDTDFNCYSVVDERSAGFFTLGIIQATGKSAAVCCTSGTATLNLAPAVAEAFYQELPLLVISADRPLEWIGQMEGQTIHQTGLFAKMVHCSVQLPVVNNNEEKWYCNRLINDAILSLDNGVKGPTHINIPLAEPLFDFSTEALPKVRVIKRSSLSYNISEKDGFAERFIKYSKKIIVVGQLPPENNISNLLKSISKKHNVVVFSDHLSNITVDDNGRYDLAIRTSTDKELKDLAPELLITIGGHTVSKRIKHFIRTYGVKEHWHISSSEDVVDTYQQLTDIVKCDNETFLSYINEISPCENGCENETECFKELWSKKSKALQAPLAQYSDLSAVGMLLNSLPEKASLHFANSHSVYLSQLFNIPSSVSCFSNRGTNGIEGSVSTAVGYAAAGGGLTVLLIGDLSFFYDMNGIWNRHISPNLRIMINNNGGGGIFNTLPGLNNSEVLTDYITVSHNTSAKGWAEQQGFKHLSANNADELQVHIATLLDPNETIPVILEVFTSIEKSSMEIKSYYQQQENKNYEQQKVDNNKRV